ncbi:MAG: hypothetical protein H0W44_05460 [Gammaproteobacteria bacterium]|nr:hypothetical protein [Gammaproteobacteria bacterium]
MTIDDKLNEYDVTEQVRVTDPQAVKREVIALFNHLYPAENTQQLTVAFDTFAALYEGHYPGYHACDTIYHDIQHTLDMTLSIARMIAGYEKQHDKQDALGPRRAKLGIITALFHDSGYIRKVSTDTLSNGAEYTSTHVSRSAQFMRQHFPQLGLGEYVNVASQIVHLTGYEMEPDAVIVDDTRDRLIGCIVGTGDLMTQMADRCYLEKCRDRLYPEFVLGGLACRTLSDGKELVVFASALDLLYKTPSFYRVDVRKRLDFYFNKLYHYAAAFFDGDNLYMQQVEHNVRYLERLIGDDRLEQLRRRAPDNHGIAVFPFDKVAQQEAKTNPKRSLIYNV